LLRLKSAAYTDHQPSFAQFEREMTAVCNNGAGVPMRSEITPAQTSDYLSPNLVMADDLREPCFLMDDRGKDSDKVRLTMKAPNVVPVTSLREFYRLRVIVDRTLHRRRSKLENARRVATRCDKSAKRVLGVIDFTPIRLWLRHLSTGPVWRIPASAMRFFEPIQVARSIPSSRH
jgi:hypothetical protein